MKVKLFLSFLVGVVLAASGMFAYFKYFDASQPEVVEPAQVDLFEAAKNTSDSFTYLVSSPNVDDWKIILKDSFIGAFTFQSKFADYWTDMRYASADLTATDGASFEQLRGLVSYDFCASQYYCDEQKHEGMGFNLTFWNAKYSGLAENPDFYLEDGNVFIKQTDEYIATYKPFTSNLCAYTTVGDEKCEKDQAELDQAVVKLFESFETF